MAFNRGDLITAASLNEVNSELLVMQTDSATTTEAYKIMECYWVSTVRAGESMGVSHIYGGWNLFGHDGGDIWFYRKENGTWVQKGYAYSPDGVTYNADATLYLTSSGPGMYKTYQRVNYCHENSIKLTNANASCIRGNYLRALGNSMEISTTEVGYVSAYGETITAEMLNNRQVYTD